MNRIPVRSLLLLMIIPVHPAMDSSDGAASDSQAEVQADPEPVGDMVWISATGSKYHRIPNCGNMNPDNATEMTRAQAEAAGYGACKKCY
ncbi:MAG: hypothetical protein ACLUTH_00295 [Blautia massiliensis (ex Durand et al. 2017)]